MRSGRSTLKANGGIEDGHSEYRERYGFANSMSDLRVKPNWYSDLITPYGNFAEGQARPLGQVAA